MSHETEKAKMPTLLDSATLVDRAFTQSDYAINITDRTGNLIKVNKAYLDLYKFRSEADVLGKTQRVIRSPHTPESIYKDMWATILRGETWRGNLTNIACDGSEVFVHLAISPVREGGEIIGYMGFSLDRAQQVLLEKELFHANKLVVLATMGAGLAHELNNPLASILLDAEYLKDIFATPEKPIDWGTASSAANSVIQGVERMKKVLEHLLIYSRKDTVQRFSTLTMRQVIEDSFLFIERQLHSRSIEIELQLDEDVYLTGNRTQLESVVHNLLSNSRDAFEGRKGEKKIRIRAFKEKPGLITLEYRDNAGGIPKAILDRIFEPFFTTKKEREGTGLGLAISRKIIAEHGGHIHCESHGESTIFRISLPALEGPSAEGENGLIED
jgi:PAS domain S-box-containing protein